MLENSNIIAAYPGLRGRLLFDEPMSLHTTFSIGGPADCLAFPITQDELIALAQEGFREGIPVSVVGGGSNLLVSDHGIRGLVISLSSFRGVEISGQGSGLSESSLVSALAGTPMDDLVSWCADRSLSGLESFASLPGTVGGAVFMNARCYDRSVSDAFFDAEVLVFGHAGCTLTVHGLDSGEWDYKRSPFQSRPLSDPIVVGYGSSVVLSARFCLSRGEESAIRSRMRECSLDREQKGHFRYPSAGSMFKNDRSFGKPSGKIIDEAGLRGFSVGGARVAPWHGNIVINEGAASADDVRRLVEEIRRRVLVETGFALEREVVFAGDWRE